MHKELLNAARLKIRIIPQGPLLVKAGGMDIKKPTDM
ncbi:MAG: CRISPR-associated protein, partial [Planctomycetota bacterium]